MKSGLFGALLLLGCALLVRSPHDEDVAALALLLGPLAGLALGLCLPPRRLLRAVAGVALVAATAAALGQLLFGAGPTFGRFVCLVGLLSGTALVVGRAVLRRVRFLAIVGYCVVLAVTFGWLHDLFTAHLCVEYFTVAHPFVFPSEYPEDMAFIWGVLATWWVGLFLGLLLALADRRGGGRAPVFRNVALLLLATGALAALAAVAGYHLADRFPEPPRWADRIPAAHWPGLVADSFAHLASYAGALVGGLAVIARAAAKPAP